MAILIFFTFISLFLYIKFINIHISNITKLFSKYGGVLVEESEEKTERRQERAESNVVFVGKKPAMSYVLACVTQFNDGREEVILRARGRAISHAVDVAEIVKNKFVTNAQVKNVSIGTEELVSEQGEKLNVSSIEIVLGKK